MLCERLIRDSRILDIPVRGCLSDSSSGSRQTNSTTGVAPMHLTTSRPFQSSQTSFDVEDISSTSAAAKFSLARPTTALSHDGPPTRIALIMIVIMPSGAIARTILSAQLMDSLMNCMVTRSPKSAKRLTQPNQSSLAEVLEQSLSQHLRRQIREQVVRKVVALVCQHPCYGQKDHPSAETYSITLRRHRIRRAPEHRDERNCRMAGQT